MEITQPGTYATQFRVWKPCGLPNKQNYISFNSVPNVQFYLTNIIKISFHCLTFNLPPKIKYQRSQSHSEVLKAAGETFILEE
jgi:hypothetical protein